MKQNEKPRKISRIEILEHPFHDFHNSWRTVPPATVAETRHLVDKWKQRIREVAADPNAIFILVRSAYELGEAKPNPLNKQKRKDARQFKKLELELLAFTKRTLERTGPKSETSAHGNRLFMGLEDKGSLDLKTDTGTNYHIDHEKLSLELKKRNMVFIQNPLVWAYGGYTQNCVHTEFQRFKQRQPLDFECKIVTSLSLDKYHEHARGLISSTIRGANSAGPKLERHRQAVEANKRRWQPRRNPTR